MSHHTSNGRPLMATKLIGGPQLKARLDNLVAEVPDAFKAQWAGDAAGRMSRTAPHRTGRLARSFEVRDHTTKTAGYAKGAAVFGAFWAIFIDRGTKRHTIEPKPGRKAKRAGAQPSLRFFEGGRTIFARKVMHRRMGRHPFVTNAAQDALREAPWVGLCQQAWSGRKLNRRGRVSGARTFLGGSG